MKTKKCKHLICFGPYCLSCGMQVWPHIDGFGKIIPMSKDKSADKAKQLAQNIKSTCKKLSNEMEEKPYVRPGSGKEKIFKTNDLSDLKQLMEENEKRYIDPTIDNDLTWDVE